MFFNKNTMTKDKILDNLMGSDFCVPRDAVLTSLNNKLLSGLSACCSTKND